MASRARTVMMFSIGATLCVLAALMPLVNWEFVGQRAQMLQWSPPSMPRFEGHFHGKTYHPGPDGSCKCVMLNFGENNAY